MRTQDNKSTNLSCKWRYPLFRAQVKRNRLQEATHATWRIAKKKPSQINQKEISKRKKRKRKKKLRRNKVRINQLKPQDQASQLQEEDFSSQVPEQAYLTTKAKRRAKAVLKAPRRKRTKTRS